MAQFEIDTLLLGELRLPHGGGFIRDPIHAWLVRGEGRTLLVDSGMPEASVVSERLNVSARGGGHAGLRKALAAVGSSPEAVDTIIATHLHFDHAWNLDLFPEACVVVQRQEMFHAIDPVPSQRIYYFRETMIQLLERRRPRQLTIVDGDHAFLPGIDLVKVPGHTPAMQAVLVATQRGTVALVSDLGDHYRYWYPADRRATDRPLGFMAGNVLPGMIRSESEWAYAESMRRILARADIVVPAHDYRIPRRMPDQWYDLPPEGTPDLTHDGEGWVGDG